MAEAISPLVTGVTPLVNTLEKVQDVLPNRALVDEPTTEQAADIVEARDSLAKIRQEQQHSRLGRILGSAAAGARFGGLGVGSKFGLIFGGQRDPLGAVISGAGMGALGGGAIAGGLEAVDILTEKRRRNLALQTLKNANPQLRERLKNQNVEDAARRYGIVRNAPLMGAEFAGTLGGILGSAIGIRAVPPSGENVRMPLGFNVDRAQMVNAGRWGLAGIAAGGAVGLLAGVLWKRSRKKKLIESLMSGHGKLAGCKTMPVDRKPEDPKDPWPTTNVPEHQTQTGGNPRKASNRKLMTGMGGAPDRYSLGRIVKSAVEHAQTIVTAAKHELARNATTKALNYTQRLQNMARRKTETEDQALALMKEWGVEPDTKQAAKAAKLRTRSEVVIYDDKGILGIKKDGYLLMPGGGIDDGETPEGAVYREAVEEADRKLLNLASAGVVEAVWPKGKELVDGYDGERTHFFRALDGGELGTTHDDNEGFKRIGFAEAKKFLESLIDDDAQAWAREANARRLECIVAAEKNAEEGNTEPVKLAAVNENVRLRSLCLVHASLAKVASQTGAGSPAEEAARGEKAQITAGPRTTIMAEDEPDLQGSDPAVLIDLDGTVRDWSEDGRYRNIGSQFILPNRKETLQPLKAAGLRIIGVTNHSTHADSAHKGLTPDMVHQLQHETLGLMDGHIDDVVYTPVPHESVLKPAPTMLHFAMKRFGLDPKRTIMVGDSHDHDGKAAEAAGIPFHHVDEFFRDPANTVQHVTKLLRIEKPTEKTADALSYLDRPENLYFNAEGKVLVGPDKDRRFRFPTLQGINGTAAPYEPSLRYVPPEGVAEPGAHGYNLSFNTAEAPADLALPEGASWQDPDQVLKQMYGSMGLKQNAPYRDLDRARARVILRAHRKRLKALAAAQAANAPTPAPVSAILSA
jgi:HAD superfamily hydrolase (TIGR01662 family)